MFGLFNRIWRFNRMASAVVQNQGKREPDSILTSFRKSFPFPIVESYTARLHVLPFHIQTVHHCNSVGSFYSNNRAIVVSARLVQIVAQTFAKCNPLVVYTAWWVKHTIKPVMSRLRFRSRILDPSFPGQPDYFRIFIQDFRYIDI